MTPDGSAGPELSASRIGIVPRKLTSRGPAELPYSRDVLVKYAKRAGTASRGAVTD